MSNLSFVNTLREVHSAYSVFRVAEKIGPTTHNVKLQADKFKQEMRPGFFNKYKNGIQKYADFGTFFKSSNQDQMPYWMIHCFNYTQVIGLITETAG